MESRNPVLSREFGQSRVATFHEPPPTPQALQDMYDGPSAGAGLGG